MSVSVVALLYFHSSIPIPLFPPFLHHLISPPFSSPPQAQTLFPHSFYFYFFSLRLIIFFLSNNIGQIASLQSEKHGLERIYFGGSFIHGHRQTMSTLSFAIRFWSHGAKKAYFLRHEGYLGSVGAFLKRQPRGWGRRGSLGG